MSDDNTDNLAQYLPTWQTDGRGLGATPPQDTPPLAPAYGQVGAEQPDPAAAAAMAPPPVGSPSPPSGGGAGSIHVQGVVNSSGTPTVSNLIVVGSVAS